MGCLFFIACNLTTHAQFRLPNSNPFWQGEISLKDGTKKQGYIQVPSHGKENKITFKKSKKGSKSKIKRKLISSIDLKSPNGTSYRFESTPIVMAIKGNMSAGKALMLVYSKNDYVTFFIENQSYVVDKKSKEIGLQYKYEYGKDFPTVYYFIKKKDKKKANMFYVTGHIAGIKKGVKIHCTEDKSLQARVKKGELKKRDIDQIIGLYMKTTNAL